MGERRKKSVESGGKGQQMFSKGRTSSHLCVSDLELGGYTDPQAGALVAHLQRHLWGVELSWGSDLFQGV